MKKQLKEGLWVYTNNMGKLKVEEGFIYLRGEENKGETMGYAKDKGGKLFKVIVASCDLPHCYCAGLAIKEPEGYVSTKERSL